MRRLLVQVGLALAASPLAGSCDLFVRALRAQAPRGAVAALMGAGLTLIGVSMGLFAPLSTMPTTLLIASFWLLGGLLNAWVERRWQLADQEPEAEPQILTRIAIWSAAAALAAVPISFVLATALSRWGDDLFAKPSMPREVLMANAWLWLPCGVVIGLWLA